MPKALPNRFEKVAVEANPRVMIRSSMAQIGARGSRAGNASRNGAMFSR